MNIYIKVFYISFFLISFCSHSFTQITLDNSSFEGNPADATMPSGWFSASSGTTPDILPGYWGVYNEAYHGDTYIGLITRSDGSFESIQQRLSEPLLKDNCYKLSLSLAHSDNYTGYNRPLQLRIWLSDEKSERQELIYSSKLIDNLNWERIHLEFTPEKDHYYIILEAYNREASINHEGNILIDDISSIRFCNRA